MADLVRLQKYFTDCGVLSRRAAEAEILAGRVKVNGTVASLGDKIDPDCDRVEWNGKTLRAPVAQVPYYLMLHKPRGYVTTAKDEKGRPTVTDLVRDLHARVYPVGRLDMDSEGLLLLTSDGEFANHLTHPRHEIPKIYLVTVTPKPTADQLAALRAPMELDGYRLRPVTVIPRAENVLEMHLYEGRNRQIRKMCDAVGLKVTRLCRVAIGDLKLGNLPLGKWRHLTEDEVRYLMPTKKQP
ncbi:MAG: rRNA pseudouridine synthase [Clostridia bacterium]|nr:rRNA pseudouridine synthase [Clostridia bacterium]